MLWDDIFTPDASIQSPTFTSSPFYLNSPFPSSPIIFPQIPPNQIFPQDNLNDQVDPIDPLHELSAMVDSLLSEEPSQNQSNSNEPAFLGRAYNVSLNPSPNLFLGRAYNVSLNEESLNLSSADQAEIAISHIY